MKSKKNKPWCDICQACDCLHIEVSGFDGLLGELCSRVERGDKMLIKATNIFASLANTLDSMTTFLISMRHKNKPDKGVVAEKLDDLIKTGNHALKKADRYFENLDKLR